MSSDRLQVVSRIIARNTFDPGLRNIILDITDESTRRVLSYLADEVYLLENIKNIHHYAFVDLSAEGTYVFINIFSDQIIEVFL